MFSKGRFSKGRLFGRKNEPSKKSHSRAWMIANKKRNELHGLRHNEQQDSSVMMSADSSPTLQTTLPSPGYVELPDEPRPGKITPSTPTTNTTNSSPSPRASKADNGGPELEEAIEEAVPIVRTCLPTPEPRPLIERNGFKDHDRIDGNGIKAKPPPQRDVDEDSCLIKCVYFTQQCCECTIV